MADFIPKQYTKEPITIRIAPDKLAQIDAFAAKFNMSRSEFIMADTLGSCPVLNK